MEEIETGVIGYRVALCRSDGLCVSKPRIPGDDIDAGKLGNIVDYEIVPLLKEYWFDEPAKVQEWTARLRNAAE